MARNLIKATQMITAHIAENPVINLALGWIDMPILPKFQVCCCWLNKKNVLHKFPTILENYIFIEKYKVVVFIYILTFLSLIFVFNIKTALQIHFLCAY